MIPRPLIRPKLPRSIRPALLSVAAGILLLLVASPAVMAQKPKLPKPRVLERGVQLRRDPASGEIALQTAEAAPAGEPSTIGPAIRASVSLVQVGCTVTACRTGRRYAG